MLEEINVLESKLKANSCWRNSKPKESPTTDQKKPFMPMEGGPLRMDISILGESEQKDHESRGIEIDMIGSCQTSGPKVTNFLNRSQ